MTAAEGAELQWRAGHTRRGGAKGEGSPTVNPMMDGPQASCTPAPLSPSWIAVRRNSNGKTTKLPGAAREEGELPGAAVGAGWLVAQGRALSARTCRTSWGPLLAQQPQRPQLPRLLWPQQSLRCRAGSGRLQEMCWCQRPAA